MALSHRCTYCGCGTAAKIFSLLSHDMYACLIIHMYLEMIITFGCNLFALSLGTLLAIPQVCVIEVYIIVY